MCTIRLFLQLLCMWMLLTTLSASHEDFAQDFIDHVLRIPNPERVLNSVLGTLEKNRQKQQAGPRFSDVVDFDEPESLPEYTESLQNSQERELRRLTSEKHYPICHLEKKIHKLNTNEYEYRPAYYEEIRCTMIPSDEGELTNEVCSSLGFSCIQWNKTIHLTRRRYSSDCWETKTMVIPAGCECMWPVHRLGDISLHA